VLQPDDGTGRNRWGFILGVLVTDAFTSQSVRIDKSEVKEVKQFMGDTLIVFKDGSAVICKEWVSYILKEVGNDTRS
jgi:hypothetical protein